MIDPSYGYKHLFYHVLAGIESLHLCVKTHIILLNQVQTYPPELCFVVWV